MSQPAVMNRFRRLFEVFEEADKRLLLVGGCVRDLLMENTPKDYDFATDALPTETRRILKEAGMKAIPLGEEFGTIATVVDGHQYEITTFRVKESYTKGSRHPVVKFGHDIEEDLGRRDLTINAMAMNHEGDVIDPFGGRQDLRDGVLRVPGGGVEKTREIFADDPLRLLRVGRFAGRFGFEPDESTTLAAQAAAHTILEVSRERWKTEIDKLLVADSAAKGLDWLARVGVLFFCLPELWALSEIRTGFGCFHVEETRALDGERQKENAFQHSVHMMMELPAEPVLRWAGLLHAVGLPAVLQSPGAEGAAGVAEMLAEAIGRRFRFSNEERENLRFLVSRQGCLRGLQADSRADVRRLALQARSLLEPLFALIEVRGAYVAEQTGELDAFEALTRKVQTFFRTLNSLRAEGPLEVQLPSGLGRELIQKLGVERGPRLGLIIDWLKDEVIEERVPNNADADTYLSHVKLELDE